MNTIITIALAILIAIILGSIAIVTALLILGNKYLDVQLELEDKRVKFSELELYSNINLGDMKAYIQSIIDDGYTEWALFNPEIVQNYIRDEQYDKIVDSIYHIVVDRISVAALSKMQMVYNITTPIKMEEILRALISVHVINLGQINNSRIMAGDSGDAFNTLLNKIQEEDKKQP